MMMGDDDVWWWRVKATSVGGRWWRRLMATCDEDRWCLQGGHDGWSRRVSITRNDDEWWWMVLFTDNNDGWRWRATMMTVNGSDDDGWWRPVTVDLRSRVRTDGDTSDCFYTSSRVYACGCLPAPVRSTSRWIGWSSVRRAVLRKAPLYDPSRSRLPELSRRFGSHYLTMWPRWSTSASRWWLYGPRGQDKAFLSHVEDSTGQDIKKLEATEGESTVLVDLDCVERFVTFWVWSPRRSEEGKGQGRLETVCPCGHASSVWVCCKEEVEDGRWRWRIWTTSGDDGWWWRVTITEGDDARWWRGWQRRLMTADDDDRWRWRVTMTNNNNGWRWRVITADNDGRWLGWMIMKGA